MQRQARLVLNRTRHQTKAEVVGSVPPPHQRRRKLRRVHATRRLHKPKLVLKVPAWPKLYQRLASSLLYLVTPKSAAWPKRLLSQPWLLTARVYLTPSAQPLKEPPRKLVKLIP